MIVLSKEFCVECNMPVWALEMIADRHPSIDAWIVKKEWEPRPNDSKPDNEAGSAVPNGPGRAS